MTKIANLSFLLFAVILSGCQVKKSLPQPSPTTYIFTQIPESIDTPFIPTKTPTITPPSPTFTPSPTPPPAGTFAIEFYPPLVLEYSTEQWIDKSEYNNTEMMVNYLQNTESTTCTIAPMGASGFFPENMKEIYLGSIRYQILLNQILTNGNEGNYYFAFISYKGINGHEEGLPHFAVLSNPTESEKCRIAAEEVLATLQSPHISK